MKTRLTLILPALLLSLTLWAQKKPATKTTGFYLEYSSSTQTITLIDNALTVLEYVDQYDNPMSSIPSSRKEVLKKSTVTPQALAELKAILNKKEGFLSLPKNEYGGSKEDRFYPYTINIKMNGKQKKVLYRSNPSPDTERVPSAFSEVEKKVIELANASTNKK